MLVLSRREGESVCVGGGVVVTVVRICGNKVRIGVAADKESILRAELRQKDGDASESGALEFDVPLDDSPLKPKQAAAFRKTLKNERAVA